MTAAFASLSVEDSAIMPGKSIGPINIGAKLADVEHALGEGLGSRDLSASGGLIDFWKMKDGGILEIHCNRLDGHTHIVWEVRTTSKAFLLLDNIHVGVSLERLRKAFPLASLYSFGDKTKFILQDPKQGIMFEVNGGASSSLCTSISVYKPSKQD
jgi:hypothetical protein